MNYIRPFFVGTLLLVIRGVAPAEETGAAAAPDVPVVMEAEEELWFPVGEEIRYKILWGVIPVAYSTATTEWVDYEGRRLLAIRFRTRSNKVLRKIYPVDDFLESLVDPETFLPVRFIKRLNEGRYHTDEVTHFDHGAGRATWKKINKDKTKEYDIDPDTRDLISFMYSMRTTTFPVGEERKFRVMADEKLYDLQVKALKKEEVKLPDYGEVESVKLKPTAKFEGLFVRKGDMEVWVSTDDRRVMTMTSAKIPVASVHLVLDEVRGPGDDFWVTPKKKRKEDKSERPRRRKRR